MRDERRLRPRQQFYGWYDGRARLYRISRLPPDAPVRPSVGYSTLDEVKELVHRKRYDLIWSPPLTQEQMQ